jgi:hypothetical protein
MDGTILFFIAISALALWASFKVGFRNGLSEASRFIVEGFSSEVQPKPRSEAYEEVSKAYNEVKDMFPRRSASRPGRKSRWRRFAPPSRPVLRAVSC